MPSAMTQALTLPLQTPWKHKNACNPSAPLLLPGLHISGVQAVSQLTGLAAQQIIESQHRHDMLLQCHMLLAKPHC